MSTTYYWAEPISTAEPTAADLELNEQLHAVLKANNFFETEQESSAREIVLGKIDRIVKEWVLKVSLKKKLPEAVAHEAGGKIFTLGSYRLGVHQQGADIDTLVLSPKHVDREDFFTELYQMLLARPEVTSLIPVREASTPIMKMVFSGIDIDLLHATLQRPSIPDDINLNDLSNLSNLDEKMVRSLNGPRVADELLHLVPNVRTYRLALCAIKLWAQRRCIYSNIMGYLGGIAWALMTARVCQLYPKACAGTIVIKFFTVYKGWKWPKPVTLKNLEEHSLGFRVWNPTTSMQDRQHIMPVITPAYPSMNSTYNVTKSTFAVLQSEIRRGALITGRIKDNNKATWETLFNKSTFFSDYKFFLQVTVGGATKDELDSWRGFVESRVRHLINSLQDSPGILRVPPYPDSFEHPQPEATAKEEGPPPVDEVGEDGKRKLASGDQDAGAKKAKVDAGPLYSSFYLALVLAPRTGSDPRRLELTDPVTAFTSDLEMNKLSPSTTIDIRDIKRAGLPPWVPREPRQPDEPAPSEYAPPAPSAQPTPSATPVPRTAPEPAAKTEPPAPPVVTAKAEPVADLTFDANGSGNTSNSPVKRSVMKIKIGS